MVESFWCIEYRMQLTSNISLDHQPVVNCLKYYIVASRGRFGTLHAGISSEFARTFSCKHSSDPDRKF